MVYQQHYSLVEPEDREYLHMSKTHSYRLFQV